MLKTALACILVMCAKARVGVPPPVEDIRSAIALDDGDTNFKVLCAESCLRLLQLYYNGIFALFCSDGMVAVY